MDFGMDTGERVAGKGKGYKRANRLGNSEQLNSKGKPKGGSTLTARRKRTLHSGLGGATSSWPWRGKGGKNRKVGGKSPGRNGTWTPGCGIAKPKQTPASSGETGRGKGEKNK